MLLPDSRDTLQSTDLEAGKVVSTWQFQKDGVDVPMTDLATDSKAA